MLACFTLRTLSTFLLLHSLYAVLAKKHARVQEQIKQAEQTPHQAMQDDFPQDFVSTERPVLFSTKFSPDCTLAVLKVVKKT